MTTTDRPDTPAPDAQDPVAQLIRAAGTRPQPGPAAEESVRATVHAAWLAAVASRRRRLWHPWRLAAMLLLTVGAGGVAYLSLHEPSSPWIGTVVSTRGPVQVGPAATDRLAASGTALVAGTRIETRAGGMALLAIGSISVRVGGNSTLVIDDAHTAHLLQGRLYVDSGERGGRRDGFLVQTAFGNVTHRGTQYQVQVDPREFLYTAVREGQVEVDLDGQQLLVARGDSVRISSARQVTHASVASYGDAWLWINDLSPQVDIDGHPLSTFLDWYARETGRTLRYDSPAEQAAAAQMILSGSVTGLNPDQALEAILATTRFGADLGTPGVLHLIDRSRADKLDSNGRTTSAPEASR